MLMMGWLQGVPLHRGSLSALYRVVTMEMTQRSLYTGHYTEAAPRQEMSQPEGHEEGTGMREREREREGGKEEPEGQEDSS